MVKDAEEHAEEDKAKKELIETKNQAESLIHGTEKSLTENSDKINEDDKKSIEDAISQLKTSLESDDAAKITGDLEVLTQEAMKLGEAIYKAQEDTQNNETENPEPEDSTIVDADFEEVDEDKNT
jgi:molecular chaperone DnaK